MNKVVHFEVPADDIERAQKFYKETFGWEINKAGEMPYWICHTVKCDEKMMPLESGAINGGMFQRDEANDPAGVNPVLVINVENMEEHISKIESAGGSVVSSSRQVGDMGIYARVKDTEGNIIGLWQNLE